MCISPDGSSPTYARGEAVRSRSVRKLVAGDDFLGAAQDGLESVLRGHKPPNLRKRDKGFNPGTSRTAAIRQWP